MRTFILLVILSIAGAVANAQAYTLSPGPVVNGTVALNDYMFMEIRMVHAGADTLRLGYELLGNTCNPTWEMSMCDYQSCYPSIPASGSMAPAPAGEDAFIKITMNPHSDGGTGQVRFKVWDASNPAQPDTLTFNIDAVTALQPASFAARAAIHPNPASDLVHVEAGGPMQGAGTFLLYGMDGRLVGRAEMPSDGKISYPVSQLPAGTYIVKVSDRVRVSTARVTVE